MPPSLSSFLRRRKGEKESRFVAGLEKLRGRESSLCPFFVSCPLIFHEQKGAKGIELRG